MITAYELYLRKQAGELGTGIGSVLHFADDIPMAYHWLHGSQPGQQPEQPKPISGTGMSPHPMS